MLIWRNNEFTASLWIYDGENEDDDADGNCDNGDDDDGGNSDYGDDDDDDDVNLGHDCLGSESLVHLKVSILLEP